MSDRLTEIILSLVQEVSELKRRTAASNWRGTVKDVDPVKGTARLVLGQDEDGNDVLSPALPYAQTAGALKIHNPPSVGQQMEISTAAGDMEQGTIRPLHWSSQNTAPSTNGNEHVATLGDFKIEIRSGELVLTVPKIKFVAGGSTFELTGAGLKMVAADYDFQ